MTFSDRISRHRPIMFILVKEIKAKYYYFDRELRTIKTTII